MKQLTKYFLFDLIVENHPLAESLKSIIENSFDDPYSLVLELTEKIDEYLIENQLCLVRFEDANEIENLQEDEQDVF